MVLFLRSLLRVSSTKKLPCLGGAPLFTRSIGSALDCPEHREAEIRDKLKRSLDAEQVVVEDTSGGCGTMYNIMVVSPKFVGVGIVQQHRLVTEALKGDVEQWHGLTIRTVKPSTS